ncbi:LAME_0A05182g1_1 [Lachancea meyersii CBS 8951]|uniref:LAME_0A05182g1_1 n=1 Tax=Lachancea meyersii CBS 8951 TaxID=1266667 RepID=A0A1G4IPJ1_9SACH|nr:LAME_0A05182g1_1 [Lachancea meyersii CBS 8951]
METKSTAKGVTLYRERFRFGTASSPETRSEFHDLDPTVVTSDAVPLTDSAYSTKAQIPTTGEPANQHYTHTTMSTMSMEPRSQVAALNAFPPAKRPARPAASTGTSSSSSSSYRADPRRLSSEEIINEMEKEQDAIVVRLLREIDQLKDENNRLRKNLYAVLNSDPHTPAHSANTLPYLSRRSSINSNSSSGSSTSNPAASHSNININTNTNGSSTNATSSLASTSVLALTPTGTSPAPSRRPSSSAAPIDTLTPTLLLQRKRNSVPSPVPLTPKKSDEFAHLYSPIPVSNLNVPEANLDLTGSSGFRRRRSSMKSAEGSNKIPRSTR